jgi:hypothetical protein
VARTKRGVEAQTLRRAGAARVARSLLRAGHVAERDEAQVLAPLREKERELDTALADASAHAGARLEAAGREAQSVREAAARSLTDEIAALRRARAADLEGEAATSRAESARRIAELREAAAAGRATALARILERVRGAP